MKLTTEEYLELLKRNPALAPDIKVKYVDWRLKLVVEPKIECKKTHKMLRDAVKDIRV